MSKEKEAPTKIWKYMVDTNRPYSAIDITNNLHKEFGKTCVQRSLDLLVSQQKLVEKVYGKQKVYMVNQSHFPEVAEAELKEMEKRIGELQDKLKQELEECRTMENSLSSLKSSLTLAEAKKQLETLNKECVSMENRLDVIKSSKDAISPEQSVKINKQYQDTVRQWRKRKRMANDIVNAILEGYPKSKKELLDEIGFETDEDYNVSIPT